MLINVPLDQIDDNPFQKRQDYGDVAGEMLWPIGDLEAGE